jgi:quinol monooxygenase YgiN
MAFAISVIKTEDLEKWSSAFHGEESVAMRKSWGETSYRLFRNIDAPNTIIALWEWDSLDHLRKYAESEELRVAMKNSGVVSIPETYYLEELGQGTT